MSDWSHIQSFAAVAHHGSLSAAARAMHSSQPTLSRHIAQLEADLGARLFDRSRGGMVLTAQGADLLQHADTMADAAARIGPMGDAPGLHGTVRITASRVVAHFTLPAIIAELRTAYPEIEIEMIASDSSENLLRREADIALRMYRPTQDDVITRHVADLTLGAYASHSYIARKGLPEQLSDVPNHDLIGYDRSTMIVDGLRARGLTVNRHAFGVRCDDQVACWQLVLAGCGVGFTQCLVGDADPRVRRVFQGEVVGALPVWLTAHPDLRRVPRVRAIYDGLAKALARPGAVSKEPPHA
ncbi:LysR family transcriptional regulator [Tateyamaria sp. SN6-1]|uniref:LysR family transcriptional regulator n=1 Tax=Tateyamaria sp. SN6-1 TaxID=3092148 RepID=UPI0039F581E4